MLQGEVGRTASFLHQTLGWRWRRKLCLTERTQQCQSGPIKKALFHDRCNRVDSDACRGGNVGRMRGIVRGTCGEHCRSCMEMGGACGWHRQARAGCTARTRSTREWTTLFQRTWKTTPRDMRAALEARRLLRQSQCGWHRQTASSGRVRVAPPGSDIWTSAESTIEAGPSYRRRRGVTVPSMIETICEL